MSKSDLSKWNSKNIPKLTKKLNEYNVAYRAGKAKISDAEYDELTEHLRSLDPSNSFLHSVEAESIEGGEKVRHKVPMLSTEKAYKKEKLKSFVTKVEKAAAELGIKKISFRVTPKLDGMETVYFFLEQRQ